ncbi:unnamed protein product [Gadus morhua 'NCC']
MPNVLFSDRQGEASPSQDDSLPGAPSRPASITAHSHVLSLGPLESGETPEPGGVLWPPASQGSASSAQGRHQGVGPLRVRPPAPPISGSSVCAHPTYYHAVYDIRVERYCDEPRCPTSSGLGGGSGGSIALVTASDSSTQLMPPARRRGGVVDHRDVIKAHQSHKLLNTPKARRKQWE